MEEALQLLFIFLIGIIGSFIGSIAAGAALVTVPALLLLGIPPHIALATARFGGIGFKISSLIKYLKHKIVLWDFVLPMTILGIIGAAIGAKILVEVNEDILEKLIGILIVALLPFLFLKKGVGTIQKNISKVKRHLSHVLYFFVKMFGGFFSPGNGFFASYVCLNGYGMTLLQSKGTSRIPDLFSSLSAVMVFLIAGIIDFKIGFVLMAGMFIGGYIGSHVAIKKGNEWIKPIMAIFSVLASIKLIFF